MRISRNPTGDKPARRDTWLLVAILFLVSLVAGCSTSVLVGEVSITIPTSWRMQRDSTNSVSFELLPPSGWPAISIQTCGAADPGCLSGCVDQDVRRSFFFINELPGLIKIRESSLADGTRVYEGRGTWTNGNDSPMQSLQRIYCSSTGFRYFTLTAPLIDSQLEHVFNRVVESTVTRN